MKHKIALGLVLGLGAICATLLLMAYLKLPGWIRPKIEEAVPGLEIGSLAVGVFPPRLIFRDVHFHDGDPRDSAVIAEMDYALVPIPFRNISGEPYRIGTVDLRGVRVVVHEGDAHFPKPPPGEEKPGLKYICDGIRVRDGAFTYRKDSPAGAAYIRLPEVSVDVPAFGSVGEWRTKPAEAQALALLEKSGKVNLHVLAWFFDGHPHTEVHLQVNGQRLAEVNEYFRPEEGVELKGLLIQSDAHVKVEGPKAEGVVEARYEGLDLKFHANRHRGGLSAILDNLGVKIKMNRGNSGEPRKGREKAVVTRRHPRESLVSFILRTMKEAVLRVATN